MQTMRLNGQTPEPWKLKVSLIHGGVMAFKLSHHKKSEDKG